MKENRNKPKSQYGKNVLRVNSTRLIFHPKFTKNGSDF